MRPWTRTAGVAWSSAHPPLPTAGLADVCGVSWQGRFNSSDRLESRKAGAAVAIHVRPAGGAQIDALSPVQHSANIPRPHGRPRRPHCLRSPRAPDPPPRDHARRAHLATRALMPQHLHRPAALAMFLWYRFTGCCWRSPPSLARAPARRGRVWASTSRASRWGGAWRLLIALFGFFGPSRLLRLPL